MSLLVHFGENRNYTIKNKDIKAIHFNVFLQANAVNIPFTINEFDPTAVVINVTLNQAGKKYNLFGDNMASLIACSFKSNFDLIHPAQSSVTNVVQPAGANTSQQQILDYVLDFGTTINLLGDDSIEVNLNPIPSALAGVDIVGSTASSFIDIIEEDSTGIQYFVPIVETDTMKGGESKISYNLGNGIQKIVLLNYDKADILTSSDVITSVNLSSSTLKYNKILQQIIGERQRSFVDSALAAKRYHCYELFNGGANLHLDGAILDMTLNPANLNVGKNVLVTFRRILTAESLNRGKYVAAHKNAHHLQNIAK